MPDETLYVWRVRKFLPERFGQRCRLLAVGRLNSARVQFLSDGQIYITCRYFVRRLRP